MDEEELIRHCGSSMDLMPIATQVASYTHAVDELIQIISAARVRMSIMNDLEVRLFAAQSVMTTAELDQVAEAAERAYGSWYGLLDFSAQCFSEAPHDRDM